MGRTDNVFLLTLIDFLLQIIFFGIFVYALYIASTPNAAARDEALRRLLAHFGVSDIVNLTDKLTLLVPANAIGKFPNVFMTPEDKDKLIQFRQFLDKHGTMAEIEAKLEKFRKMVEGSGKSPCLSEIKNGKKVAVPLARVVATEESITFEGNTPELTNVLTTLGYSYGDIRTLSLGDFERKFAPLRLKMPDCRYALAFVETTRYVEPRDAVGRTFQFAPLIKQLPASTR